MMVSTCILSNCPLAPLPLRIWAPSLFGEGGEGLLFLLLSKILANLHCIERGSLAYLVAREPESATVVVGQVLANTAHIDVILASTLQWHGVNVVLRVVYHGHAG